MARSMLHVRDSAKRATPFLILFVLWLASLVDALRAAKMRKIGDEVVHIPQIECFLHGHFAASEALTMIPGYHLVVAGLLLVTGTHSIRAMRIIAALLGLCAAFLFYLIRRELNDPKPLKRAAMFIFFPLVYPFNFLVYTDVLSVGLVLGAMLALLKRRYVLSAIVLVLSILVRQNNVVWSGFMAAFAAWPILQQGRWAGSSTLKAILRVGLPYLLPVAVFIGYWAWNGSIALSKSQTAIHPDLQWHRGNVYFSLFLVFVFFPNQVWFGVKDFVATARERPSLWLVPLLVIALAKLDGNSYNVGAEHSIFHNGVIAVVHSSSLYLALFASVAALAACCLLCARYAMAQAWLIYPFAAFYLSSSWMIESRYSIIPLVLWMALQQTRNEKADSFVLAAWVLTSLSLTHWILHGFYML